MSNTIEAKGRGMESNQPIVCSLFFGFITILSIATVCLVYKVVSLLVDAPQYVAHRRGDIACPLLSILCDWNLIRWSLEPLPWITLLRNYHITLLNKDVRRMTVDS